MTPEERLDALEHKVKVLNRNMIILSVAVILTVVTAVIGVGT